MWDDMPTLNSTVTLGLTYSPPGAPVNSGAVSYSVTATSRAQSVGQIDIGSDASGGEQFSIPFGSISAAKIAVVKNTSASSYLLLINGAPAFRIPAGGEFAFAATTSSAVDGVESLTVEVITVPASGTYDYIQYFIYGD